MKGILLAGGLGSRLYPATLGVSKQLLPIFDKPMIYYPLATLMLAGIREVLIITTQEEQAHFQRLFADGSCFGLECSYQVQKEPLGIAHAILIAEDFIQNSSIALILGDNFFYGDSLLPLLQKASGLQKGGWIFAYEVKDPNRYGVVRLTKDNQVLGIQEKPKTFYSNYAIPGLYFYDNKAVELVKQLTFSARGELEITDLHKKYLERKELVCTTLQEVVWFDAGTFSALLEVGFFVKNMQEKKGCMIGAIEEIAYRKGYICAKTLEKQARKYPNTYGKYLLRLLASQLV